jgi:outer membrane lipoprotein-sorting protein
MYLLSRICFFSFLLFLILSSLMVIISPALSRETLTGAMNPSARSAFLNRLSKVRAGIRTFQADFKEERRISSIKRPLLYEGRVYYNHKGIFFMAYQRPVKYVLQVKGTEALFYVEGSATADVVDISGLKGLGKRPDLFTWDPSTFKGDVWEETEGYRLQEAAPKKGEELDGGQLAIFLDRKTLLARRIWMKDASGDFTKITFSNAKVNRKLPSEVLQFALPKGTKLNRLGRR